MPVLPLPGSAAADANAVRALVEQDRRDRLRAHASRVAVVALAVAAIVVGVSGWLSYNGTRSCAIAEGTEVCVERTWWPWTLQVRSELWTKDGVPHGPRLEWHWNGRLWLSGEHDNGMRVGRWGEHWDNGNVRFEGTYDDDVLTGEERWYYRDGSLEWSVMRVGGRRDGFERWYWPNGNVRREGTWKAGEKHGDFRSYGEDGSLLFVTTYREGLPSTPPLP